MRNGMSKKKDKIKRTIEILGLDINLNVTKVVCVDVPKKFIILEEYKDNEYRLTYTKNLIDDIQKVSGLIIHRTDE